MGNTWSLTSGRTRKSSKYRKSDISSPLKNGPPFPQTLLLESEHFPSLLEKLQGPQTRGSEKMLTLRAGNTEVEELHDKGRSSGEYSSLDDVTSCKRESENVCR